MKKLAAVLSVLTLLCAFSPALAEDAYERSVSPGKGTFFL